jgi:hypothetical protein
MWFGEMPPNAIPALTPAHQKEMNLYKGRYEAVPNRKNVWRKTLNIDGSELQVFVIQTET